MAENPKLSGNLGRDEGVVSGSRFEGGALELSIAKSQLEI